MATFTLPSINHKMPGKFLNPSMKKCCGYLRKIFSPKRMSADDLRESDMAIMLRFEICSELLIKGYTVASIVNAVNFLGEDQFSRMDLEAIVTYLNARMQKQVSSQAKLDGANYSPTATVRTDIGIEHGKLPLLGKTTLHHNVRISNGCKIHHTKCLNATMSPDVSEDLYNKERFWFENVLFPSCDPNLSPDSQTSPFSPSVEISCRNAKKDEEMASRIACYFVAKSASASRDEMDAIRQCVGYRESYEDRKTQQSWKSPQKHHPKNVESDKSRVPRDQKHFFMPENVRADVTIGATKRRTSQITTSEKTTQMTCAAISSPDEPIVTDTSIHFDETSPCYEGYSPTLQQSVQRVLPNIPTEPNKPTTIPMELDYTHFLKEQDGFQAANPFHKKSRRQSSARVETSQCSNSFSFSPPEASSLADTQSSHTIGDHMAPFNYGLSSTAMKAEEEDARRSRLMAARMACYFMKPLPSPSPSSPSTSSLQYDVCTDATSVVDKMQKNPQEHLHFSPEVCPKRLSKGDKEGRNGTPNKPTCAMALSGSQRISRARPIRERNGLHLRGFSNAARRSGSAESPV